MEDLGFFCMRQNKYILQTHCLKEPGKAKCGDFILHREIVISDLYQIVVKHLKIINW